MQRAQGQPGLGVTTDRHSVIEDRDERQPDARGVELVSTIVKGQLLLAQ